MQVTIESTTPIERQLTIDIPSQKVEEAVNNKLKGAAKTVRIKGFRPGKVPMKLIKRRYGDSIRMEVVGDLMRESCQQAIVQEGLKPAGSPTLDPKQIEEGKDLRYVATLEVFPEIEVKGISELKLVRETAEVTEDDVDRMVEMLRKQKATQEPVDRPAETGDQVKIDFAGTMDGEAFEGGSGEDFDLELGSGHMITGFEEGLVGATAGEERKLSLVFPDDYHVKELAGKPAEFTVTVKSILSSQLPPLDDEFIAQFGVAEGGEAQFRTQIRENMARELQQATSNKIKQQVIDGLVAANEFPLPKALVAGDIDALREDAVRRFGNNGQIKAESLPAELFQERAEGRVRAGLLLNAVFEQNGLEVSDERVDAHIRDLSATYQDPEEFVNWYSSNPEMREKLVPVVKEDVVIDYVVSQAEVEERAVSYEEAVRPPQKAAAPQKTETAGDTADEPESEADDVTESGPAEDPVEK